MNSFLSKWLSISILNLSFVAALGLILRYKIAYSLPFLDQKYILHSHSHFAFSGWITQTLMILMIFYLSKSLGKEITNRYRWLLYANLISSYGMMISFILQGYGLYSISFSTLNIFAFYAFAFYFWLDLNRIKEKSTTILWFKAALVFGFISSFGAFNLAYMMANKMSNQNVYLTSIYFFLHFQYNGWFLFAGMGLLNDKLEIITGERMKLYRAFQLFCFACIPAYFLSILWMEFISNIYILLITAVISQLASWIIILNVYYKNRSLIRQKITHYGKILLILSALAFSIKLILQSGSIHPELSHLSYGFRPIIIGYLHLVLLGVTSIFLLGYIVSFELIRINKLLIKGIFIFVAGVIINELLLMIQGVAALSYTAIPYINEMLLAAAVILFSGILIMLISRFTILKKEVMQRL
ncbi:MAG: hypothetical protein B7X86_05605 [Sphingobacteriales bacterium 17-39-43]|uniref:hypothetical protein n=1 Tax=Daejeonella sp. TaxID=2805397 RepID=UPI000BC68D23|nr:hypothetical protein [Daejeonella sp.]OYZ31934.1 MAG: hypothetical protein B7Y24_06420 [Sphingobacteriales bacterium 16-39-50]OZA25240.1 MAG: hypothetical protein B7X86_05605 [Sphingobacteriales bacterium 17-39-43]HQT23682.1 hypothetical protein [Daejeonella sp.]HQT58393.1 hypothetical protein [Daejeonella sp.]